MKYFALTRRQCQTAVDLARRLAVEGWLGPDVRKAIDRLLGHPLADLPVLEAECRNAFFKWRRINKRRAAR